MSTMTDDRNDEQFEAMSPEARYTAFMRWIEQELRS